MSNKTIIATIVSTTYGNVIQVFPGELTSEYFNTLPESIGIVELTEDHIDELLQINQAYYKRWLDKAILNFPIL